MALQIPYNVGDIINYFSPEYDENFDMLIETIKPSALDEDAGLVGGINIESGTRDERFLPIYLGRHGSLVITKKA